MLRIENWDHKSGTCVIEQNGKEFTLNLYGYGTCNTFLCAVFEYTNPEDGKTHELLQWFFFDENHGKIMLGLKQGQDGRKENRMDPVRKITLYKKACSDWKKIMTMFAEAFADIVIELKEDAE